MYWGAVGYFTETARFSFPIVFILCLKPVPTIDLICLLVDMCESAKCSYYYASIDLNGKEHITALLMLKTYGG